MSTNGQCSSPFCSPSHSVPCFLALPFNLCVQFHIELPGRQHIVLTCVWVCEFMCGVFDACAFLQFVTQSLEKWSNVTCLPLIIDYDGTLMLLLLLLLLLWLGCWAAGASIVAFNFVFFGFVVGRLHAFSLPSNALLLLSLGYRVETEGENRERKNEL